MAKRFITIAGNIGSGKTTLTNLLAERYGWTPYYESVTDNPYLPNFYEDMARWSFPLQMFFLSKRFQAHQKIVKLEASAIQDRSIYEDAHIFARALREAGALDERDHTNYLELFSTMSEFLTPPDLVIYVRRSVPCLIERIRERGRDYEKTIPAEYLTQLNRCYDDWIGSYRLGKVLTVEADDLDLKWKKEHLDYLCERMENSLEQPELFTTC
jgi:deoxyadenosine/deoxycytidine kinase